VFADNAVPVSQFPDFVVEGDTLHISCAVNYTGSVAPGFEWSPSTDNNQVVTNTSSSINSSIAVTVPSGGVQRYTCYVTFDGSVFLSADNQTLKNTSSPVNASGKWNTSVINSLFN